MDYTKVAEWREWYCRKGYDAHYEERPFSESYVMPGHGPLPLVKMKNSFT
jgi:hypothetical protein